MTRSLVSSIPRRLRTAALVGTTTLAACALAVAAGGAVSGAAPRAPSFLAGLHHNSLVGSTVPANGDVNPYGVAVVPASVGKLHKGDVLVSNFNAKSNEQGTGTTIVELSPAGKRTVFSHVTTSSLPGPCPGGVGLTTALVALPNGWVIVGSLPTSNGNSKTAKGGCLIVISSDGMPAETIAGGAINGPWDLAASPVAGGEALFVTNVLNGTVAAKGKVVHRGTVVRVVLMWNKLYPSYAPGVVSKTVIAKGFPERTDPSALVLGPTGDALASNGTLYVANTLDNSVTAVSKALHRKTAVTGGGTTVSAGGSINAPLGLALAPNGDILVANGGNGDIVEITPAGKQVTSKLATSAGGGALFGLAVAPGGHGLYFVNDAVNTLRLLH
jgi:hypothetical protein